MYITPIPLLALSVSLFLSPIYALPGTNTNANANAIAPRHAHANESNNAASSSRIANASATTGTRTNNRNSGNQYGGGGGLDNKGNMVCTGKCWYSKEKLQCRKPYVPMVNENDDCYLCCVTDDAHKLGSGLE